MVNSNHQLISSNTHFDAFAGPMLITASSSSLNAHFINSSMNANASAFKSRAKRHYRYNNNDNSNNNNNNNNNNNFNNFNNNDENANIYGGFIEQRVRGNHIPQCPCVINPGSNRCIAYDSRYQAASIEEAIVSFPDFTADPRYLGETIDAKVFLCKTLACQACAKLMIDRLKAIGFLRWNTQLSINVPYSVDTRLCRRLRFSQPHRRFQPPRNISPAMRAIIEEGKRRIMMRSNKQTSYALPNTQQSGDLNQPLSYITPNNHYPEGPSFDAYSLSNGYVQPQQPADTIPMQFIKTIQLPSYQSSYITSPTVFYPQQRAKRANEDRSKRQSAGDRIIGNRFVISCIERGESESDESDMLTLCSACWTWRQLPEDYFPRLLNELVCKNSADAYCLSGWGSCEQKYRNLDVLRKVSNQWVPTTISIASCCNCRCKAGTEIHALVVGDEL